MKVIQRQQEHVLLLREALILTALQLPQAVLVVLQVIIGMRRLTAVLDIVNLAEEVAVVIQHNQPARL